MSSLDVDQILVCAIPGFKSPTLISTFLNFLTGLGVGDGIQGIACFEEMLSLLMTFYDSELRVTVPVGQALKFSP
jgi:hypothetical protein